MLINGVCSLSFYKPFSFWPFRNSKTWMMSWQPRFLSFNSRSTAAIKVSTQAARPPTLGHESPSGRGPSCQTMLRPSEEFAPQCPQVKCLNLSPSICRCGLTDIPGMLWFFSRLYVYIQNTPLSLSSLVIPWLIGVYKRLFTDFSKCNVYKHLYILLDLSVSAFSDTYIYVFLIILYYIFFDIW